jgi:DNA invertase Pin-like site-specific DNA recombinase
MTTTSQISPIGISYILFSDLSQEHGNSVRRQSTGPEAWCQRNGVRFDTSLSIRDLGVSAFKGKHRDDKHNLGKFLKLVEDGRVPKGSYLIIENLDRLSREDERTALRLWMDILDQGINIVQLEPETVFRHDKCDMVDIFRAIIELSRGHSESKMKSIRVAKAWEQKRRAARESGEIATGRLPGWIQIHNGKLVAIPEHAATVERVFQLSGTGYGTTAITKRLIADKVPPFLGVVRHWLRENPATGEAIDNPEDWILVEKPGVWNRTYIKILLNDRRVLGEFQFKNADGSPDGEPIKDYFPAVVTEDEWYAARASRSSRDRPKTRNGKHLDLFNGLLRDALTGDTMMITTRVETLRNGKKRYSRLIVNTASGQGQASCLSFPLPTFERAILSCLREIDPREILKETAEPDRSKVLEGELNLVQDRIDALALELLEGNVAEIAAALRKMKDRKKELEAELEAAKLRLVRPLDKAWEEVKSLVNVLEASPDVADTRLRLKAELMRIVDAIWLVIVARGRDRLCAVQIWFAGGKRRRDYLILHRPPRSNGKATKEGGWWVRSLASVAKPGDLDLRKPAQAAKLEGALSRVDPADLDPGS